MFRHTRAALRCFLAGVILVVTGTIPAVAADPTPFPEYTGDRVYVSGVPDSFQSLASAVKELERGSPQSYFVVVVRTVGSNGDVSSYLDGLFSQWSEQARKKGLKLDPERSVIALLAIDDRKAAVHVGPTLREKFGLDKTSVSNLINQVVTPFAREKKYAEAAAAYQKGLVRYRDPVIRLTFPPTVPAAAISSG